MTRLREEDVRTIGRDLHAYDADLVQKTGQNLKGIALGAIGMSESQIKKALSGHPAAAVPITGGEGKIQGFTEAVGDILEHLGATVIRISAADAEGMAEAVEGGAEIVFLADDRRFIAMNLVLRKVVDNGEATARGYATALELMAGTLKNRAVLVIGAGGSVGRHAVNFLVAKGAIVSAYDIDRERANALAREFGVDVVTDLDRSLRSHTVYFDASPAAEIIDSKYIGPETILSAPGIPLGVSRDAYAKVRDRLIHDPLQIGVATMLAEAVSPNLGVRRHLSPLKNSGGYAA